MFAVRLHGRGGQGVVTSAEMLSVAAFTEGKHAQALPTFGSERTGAQVTSFCRIDDVSIRAHEPITSPEAVIIQDPTLLHVAPVLVGTLPHTFVLINSSRPVEELGVEALVNGFRPGRVLTVPATELARHHIGRPLPGAPLLGAFSALTGLISFDSVAAAIRQRFAGELGESNVAAARAAYEAVVQPGSRYANA